MIVLDEGGAEGHSELAIAAGTNPADGTSVPAAVENFVFANEGQGGSTGEATDSGCWMQVLDGFEDAATGEEIAADRSFQVLDIL